MKDREMGDHFQICVLFQAITVLYSASIPHTSRRPPSIPHPSRRPPNISHPSRRPPNISHQLARPPNISHPSRRPPNISQPSRRPPNISHPLGRPPNISHPPRRPPNPQLLEDSMKLFNEGLNNSSFLYKLLEVNLPSQADSHDNNSLSFVIKETVCRKSEEIPGECPFKEGGVMKNCTAVYSEPGQDKAELSCQTLDPPTQAPSLPPTTSEGADEDRSGQSHHKAAQFINSGKKNEATFLDVIGRPLPGSHLSASCLKCIFDDLPKTHK